MSSCYHQKDCYTYYRLTSFQRSREKRFAFRRVPLSFSLYVLPVDVFLKDVFKISALFLRRLPFNWNKRKSKSAE